MTWDHPRICGEKDTAAYTPFRNVGSPPHMRGKELFFQHCLFAQRITPAYAGKSDEETLGMDDFRDHPRVCGEKKCPKAWCIGQQGSPPRMRGKGRPVPALYIEVRITPAYAGKSLCCSSALAMLWDHPRICGEKFWALVRAVMALGSPPHMRGKVSAHTP